MLEKEMEDVKILAAVEVPPTSLKTRHRRGLARKKNCAVFGPENQGTFRLNARLSHATFAVSENMSLGLVFDSRAEACCDYLWGMLHRIDVLQVILVDIYYTNC